MSLYKVIEINTRNTCHFLGFPVDNDTIRLVGPVSSVDIARARRAASSPFRIQMLLIKGTQSTRLLIAKPVLLLPDV